MSSRTVHAACPHDCPDTCAIRVSVENGVAVRVQGDPDHPPTHGALCTKVARYTERVYHPERLLHPLRRTGPKGSGRFERVTWPTALDEIGGRLREIAGRDAQAILPYSYSGTLGLVQGEGMASRFFNRLGASRLDRTICASAGATALNLTYGSRVGMHVEHFQESRLILIWGSNSIASNLHFWTFAQAAKRAGAKLICIDPRRTETADKCHQHLALLPGTDGALALGLIHQLCVNDWLDLDYIGGHTAGWEALRAQAASFTAERTAELCGLEAGEVRALARDYGTLAPAAIRLNYGMQRVRGGGSAVRLIAALPCLIGAWRHRAGGLLLSSSGWPRVRRAALERPDLLAGRTPRTINMSTIGDDLLRGASAQFGPRIEAVIVYNSNPVAVAPESPKVVRGFSREDLFTVVLEQFQTDTADHADIILPATTQLEHFDVHTSYGHTYVMVNEPAVAPLGEARPTARSSAAWRRRWDSRTAVSATPTNRWAHRRSRTTSISRRCAATAGCAWRWLRRRSRTVAFRQPMGARNSAARSGGGRIHATLRIASIRPGAGRALSARDDFTAGAAFPEFELRQRAQPAQHRGRTPARDASRRCRGARSRRWHAGEDLQ